MNLNQINKEPRKEIAKDLLKRYNAKKYLDTLDRAKKLLLNYPESLFLLDLIGVINFELVNYDEAIENYKRIITINPNFSNAYYNLGNIYKRISKIDKALVNYINCIKINPKRYEAYNNIANIYKDSNKDLALENYLKCLDINPNYLIGLQNFGIFLQSYEFKKYSDRIDKHLITLLRTDKILRPVDIINTLVGYLYLDAKLLNILKNYKKNYDINRLIDDISNYDLLIELLRATPITDLKIEKLIKHLRSEILLNVYLIKNKETALKVVKSITMQCFLNEYIYSIEENEDAELIVIENKIKKKFINKDVNNLKLEIICLASYKSLKSYSWFQKISNTKGISEIINEQIIEPNYENNLKQKIRSFKIKDTISTKVQDQYENNPYPRWNKISVNNKPKKIFEYFSNLNLNIETENIKGWKNLNVLVAGCGTGQHAIATASKFENAFITAIDLSLNSLSYAKRKAEELKIENIEFIQMDILDLNKYSKKFNVIESVGVIHHMKNPFEGLKNLYNILEKDGLIMIGLYSKIARQHIKRIRENKKIEYKLLNNQIIRKLREEMIISNNIDHKLVTQSTDFYTLSSVRDLLFHIQEHSFTIPELKNFIDKLNLKFCGFENRELLKKYINKYGKDNLYNLDLWNKFEVANQRIFAGMYQFWCQKKNSKFN